MRPWSFLWVSVVLVSAAVMSVRAGTALAAAPASDRGTLLTVFPTAILAVFALVVVEMAVLRARALRRVQVLQRLHPDAIALSCLVPERFGFITSAGDVPGQRAGFRFSNSYAALLVDRTGIALYRGASRVRIGRSIPGATITAVTAREAAAGPVRIVPSIIVTLHVASGVVEVPLQLAEWDQTLFPRFGNRSLIQKRAAQISDHLGLVGSPA